MWQFFIVPCKAERERNGVSLSSVMSCFYELKKVNPDMKLLFSDVSEKIRNEE